MSDRYDIIDKTVSVRSLIATRTSKVYPVSNIGEMKGTSRKEANNPYTFQNWYCCSYRTVGIYIMIHQ